MQDNKSVYYITLVKDPFFKCTHLDELIQTRGWMKDVMSTAVSGRFACHVQTPALEAYRSKSGLAFLS